MLFAAQPVQNKSKMLTLEIQRRGADISVHSAIMINPSSMYITLQQRICILVERVASQGWKSRAINTETFL